MMRKILFAAAAAAVVGLFAPCEASAQFPGRRVLARTVQATTGTRTFQPVRTAIKSIAPHYHQGVNMSIYDKANWLARNQLHGHVGSLPPGGLFEGTATNFDTPEQAKANTCKPANGGTLVDSVVVRQPNGKYTAVNYYRVNPQTAPATLPNYQPVAAAPTVIHASYQSSPVVIHSVGTAHVSPRAVWRPVASVAATCTGPNCNTGR